MFVQGQQYKRSKLHDQYGGQRRGGISTPRGHPLVLVFTGESGQQYGYADRWTDDGSFEYTGEGQRGDMRMNKGNAAILKHAGRGKDLHLFELAKRGYVRYVGQMVCAGFLERQLPDVDRLTRKAVVFRLLPIEATTGQAVLPKGGPRSAVAVTEYWTMPMNELRSEALDEATGHVRGKRGNRPRTVYERSEAVRVYGLRRADGTCEACESPAPFKAADGRPYLELHHIRRLSDGGPDDPRWVAGVCPNCHRRAHYGQGRKRFNRRLANRIQAKEVRLIRAE